MAAAFSAQLGAIGTAGTQRRFLDLSDHHRSHRHPESDTGFWFWPWTEDSIRYDWQEAQIRDTDGNVLAQVFKIASNAQAWTYVTFDLTPYKGQTIQLYFNAHEDGGSTAISPTCISTMSPSPARAIRCVSSPSRPVA